MLRVGHLGRCLLLEPWFEEAGGGKGVSPAVLVHKGMVSWYGRCGCDVWVVVCRLLLLWLLEQEKEREIDLWWRLREP
jgi:hypothetical protein